MKPALEFVSRYVAYQVNSLLPGNTLAPLRSAIWRCVGIKIGRGCNIYHSAKFISGALTIGDNVYIGPEALVTGGTVFIGSDVDISARVVIHAGSHKIGPWTRRAGDTVSGEVRIEDGVWIGVSVTLIADAIVRRGSIVGAGSLVNAEINADCVAFGVPAKPHRKLAI